MHRKLMLDQRRMWWTEDIVCLPWEPLILTGMSARMSRMWLWMKRNMHRKPIMDQHRMGRTVGIVIQCAHIALYISDI
jgi:hypothetical protein